MVERWLNDGRTMVEMPVLVACKRGAVYFWQNKTPTSFGRRGRALLLLGKNCHLSSRVLTSPFSVFRFPFTPSGFCFCVAFCSGVSLRFTPACGLFTPSEFPISVLRSPFSVLRSPFSVLRSQFFTLITRRIPMSSDSFEPNAKWRAVLRR